MGRRALANPILGDTPILTRDEASLLSRTVYFTGTLCGNGHLDWRYVSNGACRSCMKPPKPAQPYMGNSVAGLYRVMVTRKLRLPVVPPLQDAEMMKRFDVALERAGREWLKMMGHWNPPKETDDD